MQEPEDQLRRACHHAVAQRSHDGADEKSLGEHKIGTTKRGIGPCYQDKAARKASVSRMQFDEDVFSLKVETALKQKNPVLSKIHGLHLHG